MNASNPRSLCRHGLALFGTLALAVTACGGKAASPDPSDVPADEVPERPSDVPSQEAAEPMPSAFDVLELQGLSEDPIVDGHRCGRVDYATRFKVNMNTGHFITNTCETQGSGFSSIGSTAIVLEPVQLIAVQDAYRALVRTSSKGACTNGASALTLGLMIDREELLFADEDHAGCPVPGVENDTFVSGLPELYDLLDSMSEL